MPAITIIKTADRFFLVLADDNNIAAFKSVAEGVQHYQDMFNRKYRQSYEASMSVTMFWLQAQPSVLEAPPMNEIQDALVDGRAYRVSGVAGRFNGGELKPEIGEKWFNAGHQPKLVS